MWYAAHLLMYQKFLDGPQEPRLVWENIFLIEADSVEAAFAEADRIGQSEQESDVDSGHRYGDRPCQWVYKGVRRLAEFTDFADGPPASGREVTYLSYFVEDEAALERMLHKQSARLLLDGDDIL